MKSITIAAMAVLAAIAEAKPMFTNSAFDVVPGEAFTLDWADAVGTVTITLLTGLDSLDLSPVSTLYTGTSSTFVYNVPATLVSGDYAFEIQDSETSNYSGLFQIISSFTASSSMSSTMASMTTMTTSTSMMTSTTSSKSSSSSTSHSSSSSSSMSTTSSASSTASAPTVTSIIPVIPTPTNTSGAKRFSSPFALVLGVVAAIAYFN
jgi:hypothetical protein